MADPVVAFQKKYVFEFENMFHYIRLDRIMYVALLSILGLKKVCMYSMNVDKKKEIPASIVRAKAHF